MDTLLDIIKMIMTPIFRYIPQNILASIGALTVLFLIWKFAKKTIPLLISGISIIIIIYLYKEGFFDSIISSISTDWKMDIVKQTKIEH